MPYPGAGIIMGSLGSDDSLPASLVIGNSIQVYTVKQPNVYPELGEISVWGQIVRMTTSHVTVALCKKNIVFDRKTGQSLSKKTNYEINPFDVRKT